MTKFTEYLIRALAIVLILYFGWQIAAQTVVQLIQQQQTISRQQQALDSLQRELAAAKTAPGK